tara:strand:+ start:67 stop:1605 length:1539 start_codon:yes stop_codon:yes gene_type:complete
MRTLSVQNSHNASICEVDNKKIVYFQEAERLDGIKKSTNWIILLQKYLNTEIDKFIFVHASSDYPLKKEHVEQILKEHNIKYKQIEYKIDHHFYHACAAFFNSGLEQSYVFILDGAGCFDHFDYETSEIASLYLFKKNKYKKIFKVYCSEKEHTEGKNYFINTLSLGNAYLLMKQVLKVKEEGSVMALSCYGNNDLDKHFKLFTKKFNHFTSIQKDMFDIQLPYYKNNTTALSKLIQKRLEEIVISYVKNIVKNKKRNLCVSGGVFQNTVLNSKLLDMVSNLYVDPCADDSGISMGAALWDLNSKKFIKNKINTLFLGDNPNYQNLNIQRLHNVTYEQVAKLISEKNIVAIYQGKNEIGKRALGNRSFLYDPRDKHAKEKINLLKNREWFRPTAGTVLHEHAHEWFNLKSKDESEFMSYVFQVKKPNVPGITHVDNTCRIQTLRREQNFHYYNLIKEFYNITGVPILLNTSFNLAGKPLVNSVQDAINTINGENNYTFKFIYFPELGKLYVK